MEEEILRKVAPTTASQRTRAEVFQLLKKNVEKCLARYHPYVAVYGSWPLQTCTPCGDLDLTIIIPQDLSETQVSAVLSAVRNQMEFVAKIRPTCEIKDFIEVNADVKLLKFWAKGVAVDLSVNQTGGLMTLRLLEFVDSLTENHLLKRSLLLVKSWATYEARISGSRYGLLASYALAVLTVCTINTVPAARTSPFKVLKYLIDLLVSLDWENTVVTCFGVVPRSAYGLSDVIGRSQVAETLLFTPIHLERLTGQLPPCHDFQWKYVNISDPLKPSNNLGRSVNRGNWERIKLAAEAAKARSECGAEALFPTTLALPTEPGEFRFSSELENVQKVLRRQVLQETQGGKWWHSAQPRKVAVSNR